MKTRNLFLLLFLGAFTVSSQAQEPSGTAPGGLTLAGNGTTAYRIVRPSPPSIVDTFAIEQLRKTLREQTGVDFPVVDASEAGDGQPGIFIGMSNAERLGPDMPRDLKEDESVVRTNGRDVFLFGEGIHGNLYAIVAFMEEAMGWRWYSFYEQPVIPKRPELSIAPLDIRRGFSFRYRRTMLPRNVSYFYLHGANMGFESKKRPPEFVSTRRNHPDYHTLFYFIPPNPKPIQAEPFPWLENKDYFKTNPEFFSMNRAGVRVDNRQLCFSNPGLREELTKNVREQIRRTSEEDIVSISAMDVPGAFCECADCKALEEKYQTPGGPIIDYLIDLCAILKTEHPRTLVYTAAYRRKQTQKPPVLPEGQKLPENLIVDFAPIEDSFFADWTHPDPANQETLAHLRQWGKLSNHLWCWMYPNAYGSGTIMPVGVLDRIITNLRLMHDAGVTGVFFDHVGMQTRAGFSELQTDLILNLVRDINCDTDAVIREFTDWFYGDAGGAMRVYLKELEQARKDMKELPKGVTYSSGQNFELEVFPYLTAENIHKWQGQFDAMEKLVANDPERLVRVQRARRELDLAALNRWFDLQAKYPDAYKDHEVFVRRIAAINAWQPAPPDTASQPLGTGQAQDFVAKILGGGKEKPLPQEFDGIAPSRIRTYIPKNHIKGGSAKVVLDPEAAFGYAATVDVPDYPLTAAFCQWEENGETSIAGPVLKVTRSEMTSSGYKLYKLGTIEVTPNSWIWFSGKSSLTHLKVGDRVYEPGEDNLWDAYFSMKCDGPTYGGKAEKDSVLVDRIILVRKDEGM